MQLTKEQIEQLRPYERHLRTAYYGDVALGISTVEAKQLFGIFNAVTHSNEQNTGCGSCRLNVLKRLGRLYFEQAVAQAPEAKPATKRSRKTKAQPAHNKK